MVAPQAFIAPSSTQAKTGHNNLSGIQGGKTNEYYHLTSAEHAGLGGGGVPANRNITINGVQQDLSVDRTWTVTTISGNAGTATKLATPVTINSVSFDGSGNITVPSDIAPGTTGNVLTSNGLTWTSAAPAASGLTQQQAMAIASLRF